MILVIFSLGFLSCKRPFQFIYQIGKRRYVMKKQRSIITKSLALLLCIALMMGNVCPCAVFGGEITTPEEIEDGKVTITGAGNFKGFIEKPL